MDDIICIICKYLKHDADKIACLSTCIRTHHLKNKIYYTSQQCTRKIKHLPYFDRFQNVIAFAPSYPKSMHTLKMCDYLDGPLKIPDTLLCLELGCVFNQPITHMFITSLIMGYNFNQKIEHMIHITHLTVGHSFDVKTHKIPSSVAHLTFNNGFNRPLSNAIPSSVTHLTFGDHFNQHIDGQIPSSVTHLTFGGRFVHQIHDCIPKSVKYLEIGSGFGKVVNDCVPLSVTHLTLNTINPFGSIIPPSVTHLTFHRNFVGHKTVNYIPETVTHVYFNKMMHLKIPATVKCWTIYLLSKRRCSGRQKHALSCMMGESTMLRAYDNGGDLLFTNDSVYS